MAAGVWTRATTTFTSQPLRHPLPAIARSLCSATRTCGFAFLQDGTAEDVGDVEAGERACGRGAYLLCAWRLACCGTYGACDKTFLYRLARHHPTLCRLTSDLLATRRLLTVSPVPRALLCFLA